MKKKYLLTLLFLIVTDHSIYAQSAGGEFNLSKITIDSGGGKTNGAEYQLIGTIAQPDAVNQLSSGGEFVLNGGFWSWANTSIFKNGFE